MSGESMIRSLSFVLILCCVAGCSTTNKSLVISKTNDGFVEGIAYSLPKQLLKVEYKRSPLTLDKLLKNINSSRKKISALESDKSSKQGEVKEKEKFVGSLDKSDPAYLTVLKSKQAEILILKTALSSVSKSLITEKKKFDGLNDAHANFLVASSTVFEQSIKFTPQPVIADPKLNFVAQINHHSNFSDELEITVKNGLLAGAIGHSEGKNDAIITAIVGGLSGLVNAKPFYMSAAIETPQLAEKCPDSLSVTQIVDPDDLNVVTHLNDLFLECIEIESIAPEFISHRDDSDKEGGKEATVDVEGFVYRQPGSYKVEVVFPSSNGRNVTRAERFMLAQGPINYISLPKSGFAKNEYDLEFKEGALTKSKTIRPSEALAIASILPNALKAIFAIPTELIQLKVDYSTKEAGLAESEVSIVKALIALDEQQKLLDAQLDVE